MIVCVVDIGMSVLHTYILIVYMRGICMYIDGVYGVVYTCIWIVCIGATYMYIDCLYGCYIHVY